VVAPSVGGSADLEAIQEIILGPLKFGDGFRNGRPAAGHGIGVALRFAVLVVGEGRLRHEGPETSVGRGVGQGGQLLVDHRQLLTGALKPAVHVGEAPFDQTPRHRRDSRRPG
jgi:hypothetical protein